MHVRLIASAGILSAALMLGSASAEEAPPVPIPTRDVLSIAPQRKAGAESLDLEQIQRRFGPAVVKITFTPIYNMGEIKSDPRQQEQYAFNSNNGTPAHGSGFFVSPDGILVTNAHVVEMANRRTIKCITPATGNTPFEMDLIGVGETDKIDLAILKLRAKELPRFRKLSGLEHIPFLRVADSNTVTRTEPIAVLGYPEDSEDLRTKSANLSGRQYLNYWELIGGFQFLEVATASAVKSGNSGGAAVDAAGDLIGIPARGDWTDSTGWLIPSNILLRFFDEVARNEQGRRKMHLLSLGFITEKTFPGMAAIAGAPEDFIDHEVGVLVFKVSKGSLAESWGIKGGDILLSFRNVEQDTAVHLDFEGRVKTTGALRLVKEGGRTWNNTDAPRRFLSELILLSRPGETLEMKYVRKGVPGIQTLREKMAFREVIPVPHLGTYEIPDFVEWGGMILQEMSDHNVTPYNYFGMQELVKAGAIIVTHVDAGSLAQEMKIGESTVISTVGGARVRTLTELRAALKKIGDEYDAWTRQADYREEKARYDPRYYALFTYHVWDHEILQLVRKELTLPIEKARAVGRSLDFAPAAGNGGADKAAPR